MKVTDLAKSELEEAGEDTTDLVNSTSKLQKQVKAMTGIDIMLDNDTFKSTYQILSEISNKWSELSDIDQANYNPYVQKCA
nr:MAG TPA: minor tail protein [Caudoviricetes sp.]